MARRNYKRASRGTESRAGVHYYKSASSASSTRPLNRGACSRCRAREFGHETPVAAAEEEEEVEPAAEGPKVEAVRRVVADCFQESPLSRTTCFISIRSRFSHLESRNNQQGHTHRSNCTRAFSFVLALDPLGFLHLFNSEPKRFSSSSFTTLARPVLFLLRLGFSSLGFDPSAAERNSTHADAASAQPHRFLPPPALFESRSSCDLLLLGSMWYFRVVREVFIVGRRGRGRRFRFVRCCCHRGASTGSSERPCRRSQALFSSTSARSNFDRVFRRGGGGSGRDEVEIDGESSDGFEGEEGREEDKERNPGVSMHECAVWLSGSSLSVTGASSQERERA